MKTYTLKQAMNFLNENVIGHTIVSVYNSIRELSIVFCDAEGKKYELYTSGDSYFQRYEDYVIIEL